MGKIHLRGTCPCNGEVEEEDEFTTVKSFAMSDGGTSGFWKACLSAIAEPKGVSDGGNRFAYGRNNPYRYVGPSRMKIGETKDDTEDPLNRHIEYEKSTGRVISIDGKDWDSSDGQGPVVLALETGTGDNPTEKEAL